MQGFWNCLCRLLSFPRPVSSDAMGHTCKLLQTEGGDCDFGCLGLTCSKIIVNAFARRLGSRAGPRTGKEERGFRKKRGGRAAGLKGGGWGVGGGFTFIASDWRGVPQGGGGGGGVASQNFARGKGWVRGKEARSGSACSRHFSAGSGGEFLP